MSFSFAVASESQAASPQSTVSGSAPKLPEHRLAPLIQNFAKAMATASVFTQNNALPK